MTSDRSRHRPRNAFMKAILSKTKILPRYPSDAGVRTLARPARPRLSCQPGAGRRRPVPCRRGSLLLLLCRVDGRLGNAALVLERHVVDGRQRDARAEDVLDAAALREERVHDGRARLRAKKERAREPRAAGARRPPTGKQTSGSGDTGCGGVGWGEEGREATRASGAPARAAP